jgi:adhesin/invasin
MPDGRSIFVCLAMGGAILAAGCGGEKTVLAPSGAALSLVSTANAVSFNGTASISARILTAQGAAAPDGTLVTFSTTLGTVAPVEVPTAGGVAMTTFTAGPASGTAVVTANSGSVGGGGVRIAVGVAAVARVQVTPTPPVIPFGGGSSVIAALVVDANNNPLAGIPVTFATTAAGATVAPATLKTDPKGIAQSTLTSSRPATVTVTAAAAPSDPGFGAVGTTQGSAVVATGPQPVPVVTVAPPPTPMAQVPATFVIGAVPAAGSNTTITNVTIAFGDNTSANLGAVSGPAISVQHIYATGGSYTVSVTATDSGGGTTTAATVIAVGFQPPAGVKIVADPIVPMPPVPAPSPVTSLVTLTATLVPPTLVGTQFVWTLGDPTAPGRVTTTLNQTQHPYPRAGTYTVKVDVTVVGSSQVVSGSAIIIVP